MTKILLFLPEKRQEFQLLSAKMELVDGKNIVPIRPFGQGKKTLFSIYLASKITAKILKQFWNVGLFILQMKYWKLLLKIQICIFVKYLKIILGKGELNPRTYAK